MFIIGWTADAAVWHIACLCETYRLPGDFDCIGLSPKDTEGNLITPVFDIDEGSDEAVCDLCHEALLY
jgi:hypothetical protein